MKRFFAFVLVFLLLLSPAVLAHSGKTYHRKYGCSRARTAVNAYDIQTKGRLCPCGICKPELPDMAWVEQYKAVKQNAKKYGIGVEGI